MATNKALEVEKAFTPARDALLLWAGLLAVSLLSLVYVGYRAERVLQKEILELAENTADLATVALDEVAHSNFARGGQMWSTQHKALIQPLLELQKRFPEIGRLQTVFQESGNTLVILDSDAFAGEIGLKRPAEPIAFRTPLDDRQGYLSLSRRAMQTGQGVTEKDSQLGPFGDFITAAAPLPYGGAVLATVDVAEMKRAKQNIIDVVLIGCGVSLIVSTVVALGFFNMRSSFLQVAKSEVEAQRGQAWEQSRNRRVVDALGQLVLHRDVKIESLLWSGNPMGALGIEIDRMPLSASEWEALIHPDDLQHVKSAVSPKNGATDFEIEYRVRSHSGKWVWFVERGVVTYEADTDIPLGTDSVLLDITDKKEAADELAALALIATRTDNAVCLMLTDGTVEWVNDAFERITGYSRKETLRQSFQKLIAPDTAGPISVAKMLSLAAAGESQISEIELRNKSKQPYWAHLEVQPLTDDEGQVKKLVAIQSDRSEAKKFESTLVQARDAAEAADRTKSEFLAVMSHEVRTPLNAVLGFSGLLMESQLNDQQRDYLRTIQTSGESLLSLVNDILDFSRMDANKFILEKADFNLRELIENSLDILGAAAAKKGLELICDIASQTPEVICGDKARLKQVILNLAGNAVKFTEEGEVVISVRVLSKLGGGIRLKFEVRDTGPGIELEQQYELFKPFSQADSTATRRHGGTGLGLAISKRLVKLMGGEIGLESSPNRGSLFWFELPTEVAAEQHLDFGATVKLRGQSVLVVEHNTSLRAVLLNQLTRWGMRPRGFSRGRDAVFAADQLRFDVAIIDTNIPDIDATRLAERLRRAPRGGVDRVVVLEMPGRGLEQSVDASGWIEVVRKPIRVGNLLNVLLRNAMEIPSGTPPLDVVALASSGSALNSPASFSPEESGSNKDRMPRVLVADDNPINRKLIAKMLAKMGFESEMVENGLEALNAVQNSSFDAVLMDLQMPEMDGLEATRQIRNRGFALPIIAITADAMPDDQRRCAAAGMNDYLCKPVRAPSLEEALQNAIGKTPL